ncbi:unnamed protein product [Vitrella brassicaformis CCMP3155]|uniref:Aminodeoxychorismate lyase n=1 Tax=Vitrella brassicaformis (strain CCMP3155) TaxID=1169540 RepID=A0A0G4ER84_VITBC|nr:unnamed protein product [Vitrella brassicaformis CCMP3155]|eukprot:CEM00514.1 unnamed protein product [Vitrella brassicaformis CCMP3155]
MPEVWLNGELLDGSVAAIPVTDRGFLFGDGIFTTMKISDGTVREFGAHVRNLMEQCCSLGIRAPDINLSAVKALVQANAAERGTWRLKIIVTGGCQPSLALPERDHGTLLMMLKPIRNGETGVGGLRVALSERRASSARLSSLKSLAYLERLMYRQEAVSRNVDDIISVSPEGWLLESAFANLLIRRDGSLYTPCFELPLLHGSTIDVMIHGARSVLGIKTEQVRWRADDLPPPGRCQLYLVNSLHELQPVVEVDGRVFTRDEDFERRLLKAYEGCVEKTDVVN